MVRALKRDGVDMVAHPNSSRNQLPYYSLMTLVLLQQAKVPIREVKVPMLNKVWEADVQERPWGGFK